ncbi:MAG: M43 family zinc metalloprotease [Bacteroidota bacterium]
MNKFFLTLLIALSNLLSIFAQTPPQRNCGTLQHHEYLKQTRANYETELNQYNQMLDQYLLDKNNDKDISKSTAAIVTIPVVVHVIYKTTAENISDAQAISQVQVLNNDFAKLNADASKVTQPTFSTIATGANIRFCLAQRDPNGNATTGVTHKLTTVTSFGTNDAVKSTAAGGEDAWDVTKYVNIWVCNLGSTLLGYGEFPTSSLSNTWGLVIHYKYTGSGGSAISPYNLGRTGTHEFGHCFNLYHIWGDDNGACSGSDQCSDTPNQGAEHYGSFTAGSVQTDGCATSSPGTMWMNYMDYTDDKSMYMFTAQQCARMEAVVNTAPWNILASSLGCTPVSALDAGISSIVEPVNGTSTCNTSVTPKITLSNVGSATLTSAKILYKIDALATQTLNWSGTLASGSSTVLTLNSYTGLSVAAHTFSATVTAPNAGTDANSSNNTLASTFTITAGSALPFSERFDVVTFPPTGWMKTSANVTDASATWTRLANTTGIPVAPSTTGCAKMNNYAGSIDITGQKDALRTPALNLSGANSTLRLVFDRSHRMYSTTDIDSLNIYISTDCAASWTKLYTRGGTQLATAVGTQTNAYTPTANSQWLRDSISLSAYVGQPSAYLKFESRSGWGNNLYLDNINVKFTPAAGPPVSSFSTAATKCTGSSIAFSDASSNSPTSWAWSFPGGTPSSSSVQNPTITYTAAGVYTITLASANGSGTSTPASQTITVNAIPLMTVNNATICSGTSAILTATGASTYNWNSGQTTPTISVSPSTGTTVYTVTGTTSGCKNTKTTSVIVNATPTVAATSKTICIGSVAALTASGALTYTWNTGATSSSITVTPTVSSNYSVAGTNSLGCTNTKTLSVTVNSLPNITSTSATICAGSTGTISASGASTYTWNTGATNANLIASPTTNTTYSVTGTSATGCIKTATASIAVGSAPSISVNSSTICAGSSTTLTATGVTSYTWSTGSNASNISVSPGGTTIYTVTGYLAGCTTSASQTATVNVNSSPTVTLAAISGPLCTNNAAITLSGSPSGGNYNGTGVNGSTFDPAVSGAGTFTITYNYTDSKGCSATNSKTVNVSLCTGVEEVSNSSVSVYPNPASDLIQVTMSASLVNHAIVEMYDAVGKLIINEKVTNTNTTLPISGLANGMYTIRVVSENNQSVIKLIKE